MSSPILICFLGSECPHDRHIESTTPTIKWVHQFVFIRVFKLRHFHLPFVWFWTWRWRDLIAHRLLWSTQPGWDWTFLLCEPWSIIHLRVYVKIGCDWFRWSSLWFVPWWRFVEYDVLTHSDIFDFVFKLLEVCEHFTLLPHRKDLGVLGEVVDERDVVSTSTECDRLSLPMHMNVLFLGFPCLYSSHLGMIVDVACWIGKLHTLRKSPSL